MLKHKPEVPSRSQVCAQLLPSEYLLGARYSMQITSLGFIMLGWRCVIIPILQPRKLRLSGINGVAKWRTGVRFYL